MSEQFFDERTSATRIMQDHSIDLKEAYFEMPANAPSWRDLISLEESKMYQEDPNYVEIVEQITAEYYFETLEAEPIIKPKVGFKITKEGVKINS